MKKIILTLLLVLLPSFASAQITYLGASYGGNGASNLLATTATLDTTGADLLVIAVAYYDGNGVVTASEISDSKGNTWTALTNNSVPSGVNINSAARLFYSKPTSVGTGHTATVSAGFVIVPAIGMAAFSGTAAASVFDGQNGNAPTSTGNTTITTGSLTPSVANALLISSASLVGTLSSMAVDASFTLAGTGVAGGAYFGVQMAYQIQTSATARNPQFSGSSPDFRAAAIASFKPSGGAGATNCTRSLLGVGCH